MPWAQLFDDCSRYIVAWKPFTTMGASDVTAMLKLALQASRLDQVEADRRPRPTLRQRSVLCGERSVRLARAAGHAPYPWKVLSPDYTGKDRAMIPLAEEPHPA